MSFAPVRPDIFGDHGIVQGVNGLLQILTGFYIASLAAVATFNKQSMDEVMPGEPPIVDVRGGKIEQLTRRRFVCSMFGYLAFISLFVYLIGIGALASVESAKHCI